MQKIQWNKVTKLSQIVAIILFVAVFYYGFYLGRQVGIQKALGIKLDSAQLQCLTKTDF